MVLCEACPAEMISALAGALATLRGLNDELGCPKALLFATLVAFSCPLHLFRSRLKQWQQQETCIHTLYNVYHILYTVYYIRIYIILIHYCIVYELFNHDKRP